MAAASDRVRLPAGIDKSMGADVTTESMIDKMKSVASNLPPLIPREWTPINSSKDLDTSFRVMQFNMLAEGLSAPADTKPPFSTQTDGAPLNSSTYGTLSCLNCIICY